MNYMSIVYNDTANAKGISTVLFVSGCENKCPECHNPQSHDFCAGAPFTEETEKEIISSLKKKYIKNLVISGGDPLHPKNIETVLTFCKKVNSEVNKKIIIYTGYYLDNFDNEYKRKIYESLKDGDMIIDGPYLKDLKTEIRDYRGSKNQNAYVKNSEISDFQNIKEEYFLT